MIRYGIIGCGMIANFHAKALRSVEGAQLRGVWDVRPDSAAAFAQKWGVRAYDALESLLSDPEVDAVCVCAPSGLHAELTLAALRHGKHVAVEKPMCLRPEEAQSIRETAEACHALVCVISQLRFSPAVEAVRQAVKEGALGRIVSCSLAMKYYRPPSYYAQSAWRGTWKMDGGGALMNQGIHGVDLMQYLTGGVTAVTALCRTQTRPMEAEDSAVAVVEFACGAVGTLEASTTCFPGYPRRLEICGDQGSVVLTEDRVERWDLASRPPECAGGSATGASDPSAIDEGGHRRQLTNLTRAIQGREALLVDASEGEKPLRIIWAVYESAREGRRVTVASEGGAT